jgi:gliding motility-associated protein GldM
MAGGKETPRQKMIGMMYLVLTALLALNVSKEILNSFVLINDSLKATNENFQGKNDALYQAFAIAESNDKAKVKPWHDKAKEVRKSADELVRHIELLKGVLIAETDKMEDTAKVIGYIRTSLDPNATEASRKEAKMMADSLFSLRNVNSKDNYDTPTNIMIGGEEGKLKEGPWTASELVAKIGTFKENLIGLLDSSGSSIAEGLRVNFDTEKKLKISDAASEPWPLANFYHIPLAAVVTNLSKVQTDVRNAEADVVKYLLGKVDASDFKFDTLAAKLIAPSVVFEGDEYSAEMFVAAFSTTQNPDVWLGDFDSVAQKFRGSIDSNSVEVAKGVGTYKQRASGEGVKKWGGAIRVKAPSGAYNYYPFKSEYMVMKTGVVVSPTKMNVLYRGVKNPISVSVPGVPPENVKASITVGNLNQAAGQPKGNYIAEIMSPGTEAIVKVTANVGGKDRPMGEFKFRVKEVPPPVGYIAGVSSGNVPVAQLAAAPTVIPKMENFDFELYFQVTKFELVYSLGGSDIKTVPVQGNRLPASDLTAIKSLKKGSRVWIENIEAVMLDENQRPVSGVTPKKLGNISLKLN